MANARAAVAREDRVKASGRVALAANVLAAGIARVVAVPDGLAMVIGPDVLGRAIALVAPAETVLAAVAREDPVTVIVPVVLVANAPTDRGVLAVAALTARVVLAVVIGRIGPITGRIGISGTVGEIIVGQRSTIIGTRIGTTIGME